ncbi:MAG: nuclear transport factor 2 family protein [Acidiferrobacterales bacterium]|nr:nuclear transport factor 2 family protein [Acidiferrobacterales bacterium]
MAENHASIVEQVKGLIYQSCLYLDDHQWSDWLDLSADDYHYAVRAYSPEISADMEYMGGGLEYMRSLTQMLPKHNTDNSPLKRHCTVYKVDIADDGKSASAVSSFVVFQTMLDGINSHVDAGESRLFMIGRYNDKFEINGDGVKFTDREVRLETRRLDKGSHWPI